MRKGIRERPVRRPVTTDRWSFQLAARVIGPRPWELIRRKAWTSPSFSFSNGISAVTSLCLVDEASAGGPPLLIAGDEDGGVAVQRVPITPCTVEGDLEDSPEWLPVPQLRRARLHDSSVNTIKLLPDKRGFVCASDDGVLSAVASLEAGSESDIRRATFALHGHSGFVTDCDTAPSGHAVLSSSTDGRMLLWDPVAGNTPVCSVPVGRAVNSACFSTGDPYAILCAPERVGSCSSDGSTDSSTSSSAGGQASDELVQIWDLRSLRTFRDKIPAALAEAFDHPEADSEALSEPPVALPNLSDYAHGHGVQTRRWSGASSNSTPASLPWWAGGTSGSSSDVSSSMSSSNVMGSPSTPMMRHYSWASDSSDNGFSSPWSAGSSWSRASNVRDSSGKENTPANASPWGTAGVADGRADTGSRKRRRSASAPFSPGSCGNVGAARGRGFSNAKRATGQTKRDAPAACCFQTDVPNDGSACLHRGADGKSWLPGRSVTWQPGKRRARLAETAEGEAEASDILPYSGLPRPLTHSSQPPACRACRGTTASVYSVQITSDGTGILTASRDSTVTLWNAQSRKAVYRFGHSRLSPRARPILSGAASSGGGELPRWSGRSGRFEEGYSAGEVFAGTTDGEVRAWKIGSLFPHRMFKPVRRHEGFEVTCIAGSRDGMMLASADSSGKVCLQLATAGGLSSSTGTSSYRGSSGSGGRRMQLERL